MIVIARRRRRRTASELGCFEFGFGGSLIKKQRR